MKSKVLLLAALLLASCATPPVPTPPAPPLPPGYAPGAKTVYAPKPVLRSPKDTPRPVFSTVYVDPTNLLYIEAVSSNVCMLSWVTNDLRAFYLTSTNLATPIELWETSSNLTERSYIRGNRRCFYVTNLYPEQYFRLVRIPSNHLGFGWDYNFDPVTTNISGGVTNYYTNYVDSFRMLYGNTSGNYTTSSIIPGQRLWSSLELPTLATNWFFVIRARCSTNGSESIDSNEVRWPVPFTNTTLLQFGTIKSKALTAPKRRSP